MQSLLTIYKVEVFTYPENGNIFWCKAIVAIHVERDHKFQIPNIWYLNTDRKTHFYGMYQHPAINQHGSMRATQVYGLYWTQILAMADQAALLLQVAIVPHLS